MGLKERLIHLFKSPKRILDRSFKHICRACHHIFEEDEMSPEDSSICRECARRE